MPSNNDTPLSVSTRMLPSGATVALREDSSGLTFDIPFSESYDQWSYWTFKVGGIDKLQFGALGDGGGGVAQSTTNFFGPVTFNNAITTSGNVICHGSVLADNVFMTQGALFFVDETGYMVIQFLESANGVSTQGNISVGGNAGNDADKVIALSSTATAPTTSIDVAQLFGKDIAAGRATLALVTEEVVNTDIGLASTHSGIIFWNGQKYKIPLILVP